MHTFPPGYNQHVSTERYMYVYMYLDTYMFVSIRQARVLSTKRIYMYTVHYNFDLHNIMW